MLKIPVNYILRTKPCICRDVHLGSGLKPRPRVQSQHSRETRRPCSISSGCSRWLVWCSAVLEFYLAVVSRKQATQMPVSTRVAQQMETRLIAGRRGRRAARGPLSTNHVFFKYASEQKLTTSRPSPSKIPGLLLEAKTPITPFTPSLSLATLDQVYTSSTLIASSHDLTTFVIYSRFDIITGFAFLHSLKAPSSRPRRQLVIDSLLQHISLLEIDSTNSVFVRSTIHELISNFSNGKLGRYNLPSNISIDASCRCRRSTWQLEEMCLRICRLPYLLCRLICSQIPI